MYNSDIKKNYLYNVFYQILAIIVPIVTTPYISRALGVTGVGKYNYVYAIVYIFSLFCWMGTNIYGQKEIAYCGDNIEDRSKVFFEICIIKIIAFLFSSIIYIITIIFIHEDIQLFIFAYFYLLANFVDISWLYQGIEDFRSTVLRNSIVKIAGLILVFIFVKSQNDVWMYMFILAFTAFAGQLFMWLGVHRLINGVDIRKLNFRRHIKPAIVLFLPSIATYVYTSLDKVMLGAIANADEVGVYSQSEKIIKLAMTIVTSLGIVMIPRMAALVKMQNWEKIEANLNKAFQFVFFLSIPMIAGMIAISDVFIPWFLGDGFERCILLFQTLSPLILIIGIASITGQAVLVPLNKQSYYTVTVVSGAAINCILNLILIPQFAAFGATFATLFAEGSVTVLQLIGIRSYFNHKAFIASLLKYTICSFIMYAIVKFIDMMLLFQDSFLQLGIDVLVGIVSYLFILVILRDTLLFELFKKMLSFVSRIVHN